MAWQVAESAPFVFQNSEPSMKFGAKALFRTDFMSRQSLVLASESRNPKLKNHNHVCCYEQLSPLFLQTKQEQY